MEFNSVIATAAGLLSASVPVLWRKVEAYRKSQFQEIETCKAAKAVQDSRIACLEVLQAGDVPRWVRNRAGVFLSVSGEFMRLIGELHGYGQDEILGSTLDQLVKFPVTLRAILREMDHEALINGYSSRTGVEFARGVKMTVIKKCQSSTGGGNQNVLYIGYAVPERAIAG